MKTTAGIILDLYDDPQARVLRETLGARPLPEKLASLDLMTEDQRASLPDRLYALVAANGDDVLRKYAMHDQGHLAASILYFMECGHLLPELAQKTAAHNMCLGCTWYGMEPPEKLVKLAGIGSMVGGALTASMAPGMIQEDMDKKRATMDAFRMAQTTGQTTKQADLTGTEMMPGSGSMRSGAPRRTNTAKSVSTKSKTAGGKLLEKVAGQLEWRGPINITRLEAPVVKVAATHDFYALGDRYPIASIEQVKTAAAYFEEHWGKFAPVDRHVYATNVQDRAEYIGLGDLGGRVREYAGHGYGSKLASELQGRIRAMEGKDHAPVYEMLLEKAASIDPYLMAEMLTEADTATGLDEKWNRMMGFYDPYRAVFSKVADDTNPEKGLGKKQWSWSLGSDHTNDTVLEDYAKNSFKEMAQCFGEDFAKEFMKDPITVFKSLPDPQKQTIARMSRNYESGAYHRT